MARAMLRAQPNGDGRIVVGCQARLKRHKIGAPQGATGPVGRAEGTPEPIVSHPARYGRGNGLQRMARHHTARSGNETQTGGNARNLWVS